MPACRPARRHGLANRLSAWDLTALISPPICTQLCLLVGRVLPLRTAFSRPMVAVPQHPAVVCRRHHKNCISVGCVGRRDVPAFAREKSSPRDPRWRLWQLLGAAMGKVAYSPARFFPQGERTTWLEVRFREASTGASRLPAGRPMAARRNAWPTRSTKRVLNIISGADQEGAETATRQCAVIVLLHPASVSALAFPSPRPPAAHLPDEIEVRPPAALCHGLRMGWVLDADFAFEP